MRKPPENGKPVPPRFVVDYRQLNCVTLTDGYPIPSENILDAISEGKFYSRLDLASGYWQVNLHPKDRMKSAFCTHLGLFEFLRMPFGLKSASETFQRILNSIYCDYLYKFLIIYVDDVILYSNSQQEALAHCELLFQRASTYGIQFKPSKCILLSTSLDILGHHISSEGGKPTNSGITAITEMPRPTTPTEVKRFLGLVGYFREYIQNMHSRMSYLRSLLTKGTKFYWTPEHEQEFNDLKTKLCLLIFCYTTQTGI